MAEGRFKFGAHHLALVAIAILSGLLIYNVARPPAGEGFGVAHKIDTLGLLTEDDGLLDNRSEMEGALELARAVLIGEETRPADHAAVAAFEGRRVFVTAYGITRPPLVGSGKGDDLYDSIVAAAEDLKSQGRIDYADKDATEFRVRVDVVTGTEKKHFKEEVYLPPRESIGTWGIVMQDAEGRVTFVTGAEIHEQAVYDNKKKGLPTDKLIERLASRADGPSVIRPDAWFSRVHCRSYIEGIEGRGVVELYRNRTTPNDEPAPENLAKSSRAAADYIARIIDDRGKHNYLYHPHQDRDSSSYNMLRHGGTTYALMQAYDRFRDPAYKEASERSFEYLLGRTELREDPGPWGPNYRFLIEDRKAKLGGSGLALVAMCQYTEATGDQRYMKEMKEFARFIVRMQDPGNGKLVSYFDYGPTAEIPDKDSIYYPGEALYGLGKFYFIDPDPLWKATAVKGADWLIYERDKGIAPLKLPHDHWLMMALSYLYAHTGDEGYNTHCMNIASAIEERFRGRDDKLAKQYDDYLGTYYRVARVTPVGCRVEGLVGAVDLCKLAGKDYQWLLNMAATSAGFSMTQQYDPINSFFLPNPRKALGGLPEGILEHSIRNDYVQHNLSGFLGTERHLLAEQGILVPGGPEWSREYVAKGKVFAGLTPDQDPGHPYAGEPLYHVPFMGAIDPAAVEAIVKAVVVEEDVEEDVEPATPGSDAPEPK